MTAKRQSRHDAAKRYRVRANREPKDPRFLGYPFVVIDLTTSRVVMLANTRRSASAYAEEREQAAP